MRHVNYSFFRSNLASVLDKVNEEHSPILVTRQNSKPAVIISLDDFSSYEETAYLMASPKNKLRLDEAVSEINKGNIEKHELID